MHRCIKPSFADRFFMTSKWCLVLVGLLIASLPHTEADAVCVEADRLQGQRIYTAFDRIPPSGRLSNGQRPHPRMSGF